MRVDIDHQDIADQFAESERRRAHERAMLVFLLGVLAFIAMGAAYWGWRGVQNADESVPFLTVGLSAAVLVSVIALGVAIIRQRRKEARIRRDEYMKNRLIGGRFDYIFAPEMLVIKGAQIIRKIAWSNFTAIENAKKSIIFRRSDGGTEFIPKNVFPNPQFGDSILAKHEALVNKPCPLEHANHATPLSVTYESAPSDYRDFEMMRLRKRDGKIHFLRRIYFWRAWPPFLLLAFSTLAIAAALVGFAGASLQYASMAIACALAAIAVFHRNSDYFRGDAFPFRKNRHWPYAQTSLVTVQLTRDGVRREGHGEVDMIRWSAFEGYAESRLFGYLLISPTQAIALPKRAFVSAAHFSDFRNRAKACMAGARSAQSARQEQRLVGTFGGKPKAAPKQTPKIEQRPAKRKAAVAARPARTGAA